MSDQQEPMAPIVLGVLSLFCWFIPIVGLPVSICGIVQSSKHNRGGCLAMSIIGLLASIVNGVIGAVMLS